MQTADRRPLASPPEVAEHLGVSEKTLAQWRWRGNGPKWSKIGKHVRYRWADVEKFVEQQSAGGTAA